MNFESAKTPIYEGSEELCWILFRDDQILSIPIGNDVFTPIVDSSAVKNLKPIRKQYLGTLDGRPCFAGEIAPDAEVEENGVFKGLRQFYGLMDDELFWLAGRAYHIINWDRTNRFCGTCGSPTEDVTGERAKKCSKCGRLIFTRISPAIIVAIVKDRQILLARSRQFTANFYSVIAGFVEPGEKLEECVRREVREEVGLEIKNINYFGSQPWPFPDSLMIGFTAEYAGGEIKLQEEEIAEAGWYSADSLPNIPQRLSIARRLIDWFVESMKG